MEGLSKISSNFALHLIKVGKLKRFKKVSSDLKTILMTDLADLLFCSFLSFEKGETCQSILIFVTWEIFLGLSRLYWKDYQWVWKIKKLNLGRITFNQNIINCLLERLDIKNVRSYFLVVIFFPSTIFVDVDVDLKFPKEEKNADYENIMLLTCTMLMTL